MWTLITISKIAEFNWCYFGRYFVIECGWPPFASQNDQYLKWRYWRHLAMSNFIEKRVQIKRVAALKLRLTLIYVFSPPKTESELISHSRRFPFLRIEYLPARVNSSAHQIKIMIKIRLPLGGVSFMFKHSERESRSECMKHPMAAGLQSWLQWTWGKNERKS